MAMNAVSKVVDSMVGHKEVADGQTRPLRSETETMRAVTWQGKRNMQVMDIGKPVITHEADAIIKVTACTICSGSDGHMYAGELPTMDAGLVIGHECMGVVESVGGAVSKFKIGQRVVVAFDIACGSCSHCKKEQFTGCEETNSSKLADKFYGHAPAGIFGYSRLLGNYDGSQAQWVRVPFADVNCYPVPDDVPDEKARMDKSSDELIPDGVNVGASSSAMRAIERLCWCAPRAACCASTSPASRSTAASPSTIKCTRRAWTSKPALPSERRQRVPQAGLHDAAADARGLRGSQRAARGHRQPDGSARPRPAGAAAFRPSGATMM
jgi:hypothetical protein